MKKIMKNVTVLLLAYIMIIGLLPVNMLESTVKADTTVPSYLKVEDGYSTNERKYKDKTIIDTQDGIKYYSGDKLIYNGKKGEDIAYRNISDSEILINAGYSNKVVFDMEKDEVTYDIDVLNTSLEKIIDKKYNAEHSNVSTAQRSVDGLWSTFRAYSYNNDNYNEVIFNVEGLIREDGKIIEIDENCWLEYIGENEIVVSGRDNSDNTIIRILDKETGKKLNESKIGYIEKISKDKIWVRINDGENINIEEYSYSRNGIKKIRTMNNIPNYVRYEIDNQGNIWYVENGYIKKISGNNTINKYKVDKKMYGISVYDDNHMVAIGGNGYTIINNKEGQWKEKDGKWYYYHGDGQLAKGWTNINGTYYYLDKSTGVMKTGWLLDNGTYYYLNNSGAMATGWLNLNGTYYYLNGSGAMQKGWINLGGTYYYLDNSGAMKTGWLLDNGTYYYLNNSGAMATGWINLGGTYYYLNGSGAMATGWLNLGGTYYYLNGSGAMVTGWINLGGTYYYLNGSGAMATGWVNLNGTYYYLNGSGAMATGWLNLNGTYYYLNGSGAMKTGWNVIDGEWYYLYNSGEMASNTTIDGWKIAANGVATQI